MFSVINFVFFTHVIQSSNPVIDMDDEIGNPYDGFMEDANENDSSLVYTPDVAEEYRPTLNQIFESLQEVYDFYNSYAKKAGFSIRSHSQKRGKISDGISRKEFVCYKQGKFEQKVRVKGPEGWCELDVMLDLQFCR